ncbi:MAG TPA: MCE family protein [Solirubrobacteraceae bacterium]
MRRRTKETPAGRALLQGLAVLVVLGGLLVVVLRSPDGVPGVDYTTLYAVVPDVGNLRKHSEVRVAGKRIGQVMDTTAAGNAVRVEIQLAAGAGSVPEDSQVVVRSQGLLGARYLQIRPGRSTRDASDGTTLRTAREAITLGVPDTLQIFDRQTRGGLRKLLTGLGSGLLARGTELNEAIRRSPPAARDFRRVAAAVTRDPAAARGLVPRLASASAALDAAAPELTAMLRPADQGLAPFVDRRRATRATLAAAPPALEVAAPALAEGQRLLRAVTRLSTAATRTLPGAPRALRATSALLRDGRRPLGQARPLLRRVRAAVPDTLRLTRGLSPLLAPVTQALDKLVAPVTTLGAHGCDIANFGQVWRSFLGFGIDRGQPIGPLGEIRASALVRFPYAEAGPAARLPDALQDRVVYPEPCDYLSRPYTLDPTK